LRGESPVALQPRAGQTTGKGDYLSHQGKLLWTDWRKMGNKGEEGKQSHMAKITGVCA